MQKYLSRESKKKRVMDMEQNQVSVLASTVLLLSFTNERIINSVEDDSLFSKIYDLFKKSKEEGGIVPELKKIYRERKEKMIEEIIELKKELKLKILGDHQAENIKNIMAGEYEKKHKICEKIFRNSIKSADDNIVKKYTLTDKVIRQINYSGFSLSDDILSIKVDGNDILKYLSYIVYKPECMALDYLKLDKSWEEFPIKWYMGRLPSSIMMELFYLHKNGEDLSPFFKIWFTNEHVEGLADLLKDNILIEFDERLPLLKEAIECYKQEFYGASITLLLPLIEGVLWDYSIRYNNKWGNIYKEDSNHNIAISSNGNKEYEDPTIGLLLNKTDFGKAFDLKFISYFCDELYNERNPIMHGNDINFATHINAAKKFATFEHIMKTINQQVEKIFFEVIDNYFPKELIEKLLEGQSLTQDDVEEILRSFEEAKVK